jgi:protoporphyrinogen/coproporphyrinogen III oxidase
MFPQFYQLEKDYRSLIVGMKKTGKGIYAMVETPGEIHYESFDQGLETLIEALELALQEQTIIKGMKVDTIEKQNDGSQCIYLNDGSTMVADYVVVTTPFNIAKKIFRDTEIMTEAPNMNYATIATVTMGFEKGQIIKYKDALNFFVSRNSDLAITTCTWCTRKWDNVAPEKADMLRVYIGRVGDESIVELSDSEIEKIVLQDLHKAIALEAKPLFTSVARWKEAMPQYTIGHEERIANMKEQFYAQNPNVRLTGSSYKGIAIPDCVRQGKGTADEIWNQLVESQITI